jgi:hypothetical protein
MINRRAVLGLFAAAPSLVASAPLAVPILGMGAQVLILGTFHFNSKKDAFNPDVDDVLSPYRQKEILRLVESLKRFRPTRIAIEWPADSPITSQRYQKYLKGEYDSPNEVVQVGFRLAKQLNHSQIYPFDYDKVASNYDQVEEFARNNGQQALVEQSHTISRHNVEEINRRLRQGTIQDVLRFVNDPQELKLNNSSYMSDLAIGKGDNYVGAQSVTDWHKRNLLMFANLLRLVSSPSEHLLAIVGYGHAPLLRQFVEDSPNLQLIDPLLYLGEKS